MSASALLDALRPYTEQQLPAEELHHLLQQP